eukprot:TRINITY_DN15367_c0_g1_i1.p1 TRINITY_DN15367_c0_g1~~TRINITY_DN15367_c0_g1_i1.p1  ORF type:complete len:393 (+),score=63.73 TRINITY_DN15367_c0_g1_i1:245-1423(+)
MKTTQYLPKMSSAEKARMESIEYKIYITWIGIWCATLFQHDEEEKEFRLEQLFDVLAVMHSLNMPPSLDIFQLIMQACLKYGSPKMVIMCHNHLDKYRLKPNAGIMAILFKAIAQSKSKEPERKNSTPFSSVNVLGSFANKTKVGKPRKSEFKIEPEHSGFAVKVFENEEEEEENFQNDRSTLDPNSAYYRYKTKSFRSRTWKSSPESKHIIGEEISIFIMEKCPKCNGLLRHKDIAKGFKPNGDCICIKCAKENIIPQMRVRIGFNFNYRVDPSVHIEEETIFLSPVSLRENAEKLIFQTANVLKVELSTFRSSYKHIFWNMVWYFGDIGLPYDFMLPYKDRTEYEIWNHSGPKIKFLKEEEEVKQDEDQRKLNKIMEKKKRSSRMRIKGS